MGNEVLVDMPYGNEKGPSINVTAVRDSDSTAIPPTSNLTSFGRRKTLPTNPVQPGVGYDGEQNTVNTLGKIYAKVLNFNVITRSS